MNGWRFDGDPPGATTQIDNEIAHSGTHSLRIDFDGSADVGYFNFSQTIPVEPNTTYQLIAYLRVKDIRAYKSVSLLVTDGRGWDTLGYSTADLYTTRDWTQVSTIAFTTLPDTQTLWISVGRASVDGNSLISGSVWVDDVGLVKLPEYIKPMTQTLRIGEILDLTVANGNGPFTWSSSEPSVAVVQAGGESGQAQVTALAAGDTVITATGADGITASMNLTSIDNSAITVNTGRVLREVPQAMFGTNVVYAYADWPDWGDVIDDPGFIRDVAELGITSLRYPGGTFANYYDFSLGKGYDGDWPGGTDQYNMDGVNTDRFIQFLRKAQIPGAMITANVYKSGYKYWPEDNWISSQVAADWVDYINHKSGFHVEYWELGNEIFFNGEIPWGEPQVPGLTRDLYIQKIHEWSRAMKAVDPTIKVGASVELPIRGDAQEWWSLPIIRESAEDIDFLIVHPYVRVNPYMAKGTFVDDTARGTYAYIWSTHPIVTLRSWLDTYVPARSADIEIQASEWGVLSFPEMREIYDTLFSAVLNTDLLWDMVQEGADGANIYSLCEGWFSALEPVPGGRKYAQYHMMWMNRHRSGKWLVESQVTSPTYTFLSNDEWEQKTRGAIEGVPYLAAYATLSDDRSHLYLIVTNKSADPLTTTITLNDFLPNNQASVWQMTSANWSDMGVTPTTSTINNAAATFTYTFPARSVTSFVFEVQPR
jgi:alpha-L-arabinofuranosidase